MRKSVASPHRTYASLTDSPRGRLLLFGLMYFVQGTMFAYVFVFNNLYLRANNATAGQLALLNGLLVLPFVLKIGIGLLSDKVNFLGFGHRVPYIALGLLLTAVGAIAASFVPPVAMYPLFLVAALFIAFGLALFDTVNDGLAIDVTPPSERVLVQGAMVVGRALGLVLLAAVYGRLIELYGWQIVFWIAAAFLLLPLPLLWFVTEPEERPAEQLFDWSAARVLWRPEILRFALYGILYAFVIYGANAIVTLFANEGLGARLAEVGDVAALSGLGMLVGGLGATLLGRALPSIWLQAAITTVGVTVALLLLSMATLEDIILAALVWGACLAASELVYVTLAMFKSDPRMGAATFAIYMAISNVGTGLGQAATTRLIDTVDFRWLFVALALLNLLSLPLLLAMRRDRDAIEPVVVPALEQA